MNRKQMIWALCLLAGTILYTGQAQAINGRQVYEQVHALRVRALDRKTEFTMTLFDRAAPPATGPQPNTVKRRKVTATRCW